MEQIVTNGGLDTELRAALADIARVPQLLIGCDYDGTLAPLVDDPAAAGPLPEAVAAVRALAALPQTVVAVISGRALRDLATLSRLPSEVHLVGSHGSEFDLGFIQRLAPEQHDLHARLLTALTTIVRGPSRRPHRDEARERCGARARRRPGRERASARRGRQRPGDLAGDLRHARQGGRRALRPHHGQGCGDHVAAHAGIGQRRPLPG